VNLGECYEINSRTCTSRMMSILIMLFMRAIPHEPRDRKDKNGEHP
jgi:hypothetical protein